MLLDNSMTKSALVTGAGGFIGSHLVEALLEQGWQVRALVRYNSRSSWGWLENLRNGRQNRLDVILGDVCDPHQMQKIQKDCNVVFHLAALIGIPYSYDAAASYVHTNVNGTLNVLKSAAENRIERFIHTSTSEVYGTAQYTPIDENHPLKGQSPYSASKIAADKLVESFYCSFDLPVVTVRPFNTFGPRQSARAVTPTIISQALKGTQVNLGSLDPVRDLTFVEDTVAGLIAAASVDEANGQVINLGSGQGVSIRELAQMVFEIIGGDHEIVFDEQRERPDRSEVMTLISDNSKALEMLGWKPEVSLKDGLSQTIDWVKEHQHFFKPEQYSR